MLALCILGVVLFLNTVVLTSCAVQLTKKSTRFYFRSSETGFLLVLEFQNFLVVQINGRQFDAFDPKVSLDVCNFFP